MELNFDWAWATASLGNFLASGYFFVAIAAVVGASVLSKLLKLLWLAGVLFLVWALASLGAFDALWGVISGWFPS